MNKEELIGKLQMTYVGDRNALNELVGYYDGLKQGIEELQQENKQLKERIDRTKDYIKQAPILDVGTTIAQDILDILKGEQYDNNGR